MMRLTALRVANVKRFSGPMAIDGFGPGLNVLSAPNEFGKSTLLAALEAVLFSKYNADTGATRALGPYAGGAPVVEVEFAIKDSLWRLRKQFLHGRMASLTELASGTIHKNADAESRLAKLIEGPPDFNRFGLLWVRQGDALLDVAPGAMGGGLPALIASEVDAVALDAPARAIQSKVRKELAELQTQERKTPKGRFADAIKAEKDALQKLAAAEAAYQRQEVRLVQLADAIAARDELRAPDVAARRADTVTLARANVVRAGEAKRQGDAAALALTTAFGTLQTAEREDKALVAALDETHRLQTDAVSAAATIAGLRERQAAAEAALATARDAVAQAATDAVTCEAMLAAAHAAERAATAAIARDRLAATISDARAADAAQQQSAAEVAVLNTITAAAVKALGRVAQDLSLMEHAFAAVVPEVTIALAAEGAGRITIDGSLLDAGVTLHPDQPLVLDIAGIGRITIAPNPTTVSADKRAQRDGLRAEMAQRFAALGVASVTDAEARLAERIAAEARVKFAAVQRAALAPHGIEALVSLHAALAAQSIEAATAPDFPVAVAEQRLIAARLERDRAADIVRAAESVCSGLRETAAGLVAAGKARDDRLAALHADYHDQAKQDEARAAAAAKLTAAQAVFTAAQSAAAAWSNNPDAGKHMQYEAEATAAELAAEKAKADVAALDQRISGLEGELRAASDDELDRQLARANATAATAAANLQTVTREVDALRLLDQEFQAIAEAGRTKLSAPILQRVEPYLTRLFGGSTLELGDQFAPAQLQRAGRTEAVEQLSKGTKEQIAILVRLGLGRLLAERGAAVPLVLDDALVYADDGRIAQMFEVLEEAARVHQVIVLNCREQTFAALASKPGATALALKPWVPG